MMYKFATLIAALLISSTTLLADTSAGETLERQMWEDMKHRNWKDVDSKVAASFQSVHQDGTRNKSEEIELIKGLNLGTYKISDIKVTEGTDSYIVAYMIAVSETIDDTHLSAKPSPRLSVWQKINGTWQWVAHANLNPIDTPVKIKK